jgi:hypothetical protein
LGLQFNEILTGGILMRLTRKQVKEALEQTPIEQILLGSLGAKEVSLTTKQREFARQIALGETKAGAYRKSRTTKAKPETASKRGQELSANGAIAAQVEAFRAAFEAQKYQTPAHLRALAIHELTKHALDAACPPAQRIRALELIGKMSEVALFVERREIIQVTDSEAIRSRLMDTLRTITQAQAVDVEDTSAADSLMAELAEPLIEAQATEETEPQDIDGLEAQATDGQDIEAQAGAGSILNSTPPATPHPPAA